MHNKYKQTNPEHGDGDLKLVLDAEQDATIVNFQVAHLRGQLGGDEAVLNYLVEAVQGRFLFDRGDRVGWDDSFLELVKSRLAS